MGPGVTETSVNIYRLIGFFGRRGRGDHLPCVGLIPMNRKAEDATATATSLLQASMDFT